MVAAIRLVRNQRLKLTDGIYGPTKVKVGFPAGKAGGDIINRAIWNHYGTSRGIPARPFLLNAIRSNRTKYLNAMKAGGAQILMGGASLTTILSRLGIVAQGDIQQEIVNLREPPNAPSTIRQKGSSNPLIDTGVMHQAVTWKVDD